MARELPDWLRAALRSAAGQRLQRIVRLHLRQLRCLQVVLPTHRCFKHSEYRSLGQSEEDDGTEKEDQRQHANETFGRIMMRASMLAMVGITLLATVRTNSQDRDDSKAMSEEEEFRRDSPIVLYLGALEIFVCGAFAHTASAIYRRRQHLLRHPEESTGKERGRYLKVHLQKEPGLEEQQLYGLGFRPSSDGLEFLMVEVVQKGSLLDRWNCRALDPSPEELVEEALGEAGGEGNGQPNSSRSASSTAGPPRQQVLAGAAILAVNEVAGDVGMMQLQLMKPKVTLWVRPDILDALHPTQQDSDILGQDAGGVLQSAQSAAGPSESGGSLPAAGGAPMPTFMGRAEDAGWTVTPSGTAAPGCYRCACVAFEDEEPQMFTRWLVCGLVFGWMTLLPVLLMRPHEERPRQHLFRQHLLKPCLVLLPISMLLWLANCIEITFEHELIRPFFYFGFCHMVVPAILVFFIMRMQAADEQLILDQRKSREEEADSCPPVVIEDPSPTFLRELITVNPIVLIVLGSCASAPLVLASLLTPMQTARARMAQGYVNLLYAPCTFLQVAFVYVLHNVHFLELPRFYLAGMGMLMSLPCFAIWSACLFCASQYHRQDQALTEQQRQERAKEILKRRPFGLHAASSSGGTGAGGEAPSPHQLEGLVDCTEAMTREWELIYSA